jgi:hypothetical protein
MLSTYLAPSSSHSHLLRLIQTTRSTRMASIQALNMQYQRMLPPMSPSTPGAHRTVPGAFPAPPANIPRHDSATRTPGSRSRNRSRSKSPVKDDEEITIQPYPNPSPKPHPHPHPHPQSNKLFCVYARDLQNHLRLPLTDNYKEGGDNLCPFCRTHISTRPGKAWEIITDSCKGGGRYRRRIFLVKNRFVIKCHREGAGFACVLCARFKESDTVCREVGALMDHLWKEHTSEELEKDDDIFEVDE